MLPRRRIIKTVIVVAVVSFCVMQFYAWKMKETPKESMLGTMTTSIPLDPIKRKVGAGRDTGRREGISTLVPNVTQILRSSIDEEMSMRVQYLQQECGKIKAGGATRKIYTSTYSFLIVNEQKKLMYCYVPKIANTNFRRVFLSLLGEFNKNEALNIDGKKVYKVYKGLLQTLQQYKPKDHKSMMNTYRKFLFVREPLERLLSGYKNKFFHPDWREANMYYRQIKQFYSKYSILGMKRNITMDLKTRTISFTDFLTYWTDANEMGAKVNDHFMLISDLCQPCGIKYDYIGKFEHLQRDSDYVFSELGIDRRFPPRNDNYSEIKTVDVVYSFYKNVPKPILRKVRNILSIDFQLFGYTVPKWLN